MKQKIKKQLILKPVMLVVVSFLLALLIINFIPYQLSKISIFGTQEIQLPSSLGYALIFAFTFKPILMLLKNLFLIRKWEGGLNPSCPLCSYPMVKRVAKRGQFVGQSFWGCFTYPKCGGIIHIG